MWNWGSVQTSPTPCKTVTKQRQPRSCKTTATKVRSKIKEERGTGEGSAPNLNVNNHELMAAEFPRPVGESLNKK